MSEFLREIDWGTLALFAAISALVIPLELKRRKQKKVPVPQMNDQITEYENTTKAGCAIFIAVIVICILLAVIETIF